MPSHHSCDQIACPFVIRRTVHGGDDFVVNFMFMHNLLNFSLENDLVLIFLMFYLNEIVISRHHFALDIKTTNFALNKIGKK